MYHRISKIFWLYALFSLKAKPKLKHFQKKIQYKFKDKSKNIEKEVKPRSHIRTQSAKTRQSAQKNSETVTNQVSVQRDPYIEQAYKNRMADFKRPSWDEYFMLQAELAKLRSNCMTRQVGAVIVSEHRQLATGYNGTPPGIKNCFEGGCTRCKLRMEEKIKSGDALDRCLCNHAEANAIMHCAVLGIRAGLKDTILYTTFVPCIECTKMAITVGIKKFVCLDTYPETNHELIQQSNVEIVTLDKEKITNWAKKLINQYESTE